MNLRWILSLSMVLFSLKTPAQNINVSSFNKLFKNYNACFILYDITENRVVSKYNPYNRCSQRISPNSTFKIPLSLIAFNQGIITSSTVFKYEGQKAILPEHAKDQTPVSWMSNSVVWVSQNLTPQIGLTRIQHFLTGFNYGNQDLTGDHGKNNGLTHAWLSSSLKISAEEQLNFLKAMWLKQLPISDAAIESTKNSIYIGKLNNGASIYGKTGSGLHGANERSSYPSRLRDGWFVGFVDNNNKHYVFVSNITDKAIQAKIAADGSLQPYGGQVVKPITIKLLNDYFS